MSTLVILPNTLAKVEDMNDKSIKYITFIEAARTLNISESTLRRKLNKLPKSDLKKMIRHEKGRVFINANIVTIFNQIDYNEKIENILVEPEKIYKESQNEIEYLRRQNEDLQNDNRNLVSMVFKLQNDIQGYIKQIGEGSREPGNNIADIIIKVVLAIVLVVLCWYLVFA